MYIYNLFGNNTDAPYNICVENSRRNTGAVSDNNTTFNTPHIIFFALQQNNMTQHDLEVRITDDLGFVSPVFMFRISNFAWSVNNGP